ncbi:MAG: iron-containing alcohol dehydrogenase, partial [Promethearchaeota archaeon]
YLSKPVMYEEGAAGTWLSENDDYTVISSPSAVSTVSEYWDSNEPRIITNPPIEVPELEKLVPGINTKWIVAIGGGRVNDTAKYLARKAKKRLCVIPPILSTTSWLNMAIALRENKKLVFPGSKHANKIIIDPELIISAPPRLSLGGLADILCSASAVGDWSIAHEHEGEKISKKGVEAFNDLVKRAIETPERFKPFTKESIRAIFDVFLSGLVLCGASFSGRPVEGSEHHMYYYLDEKSDVPLIHGNIIALTTLISLKLQGGDAMIELEDLQGFFNKTGIQYRLTEIGIGAEKIEDMLNNINAFVNERKLPYTILYDKEKLEDGNFLKEIVSWIKNL